MRIPNSKRKLIKGLLSFNSRQFEIFDLLKKDDYFFYRDVITFSTFFQAYDKGYDVLDCIVRKAFDLKVAIYIKDKKLCVIENGKKIQTAKDVDQDNFEKLINEIKKKLERA